MATKKILERMRQDESMQQFDASSDVLSDDLDSDEDDDDLSPDAEGHDATNPAAVAKATHRRNRPHGPVVNKRVFGSMMGGTEDDSGSLDSDSDLILDGEAGAVGGAMMDSDDDDDELEVNEMAAESLKNRKSAKVTAGGALGNPAGDSDDDF